MYTCMYICTCTCMYVYMYTYIYVRIYVYVRDTEGDGEIYTTTYTAFRKTRNETEENIEKHFTAQ